MAQYARRFLLAGVQIVGGCCGTTPEHIKVIHAEVAIAATDPAEFADVTVEEEAAKAQAIDARCRWPTKARLGAKLAAGKVCGVRRNSAAARRGCVQGDRRAPSCAQAAGIDCINVPDGPRASARMSAQVTCQLIQREGRNRSRDPLLLPRPQHSRHSDRNCWARMPSASAI